MWTLDVFFDQQAAQTPHLFSTERFSPRLKELINTGRYPQGHATSIQECAEVTLALYRSTRNFFALHMVTATHAARVLSQHLDDALIVKHLTPALLAAHLIVDSPRVTEEPITPDIGTTDAEHLYKYLWSCVSQWRHYRLDAFAEDIDAHIALNSLPAWCRASLKKIRTQ